MNELVIFSDSRQKGRIERYLSSTSEVPNIIRTDNTLLLDKSGTGLQIEDLPRGDYYEAAEDARETYNNLYNIHVQGKSLFKEILTLNGYSILEIWETPFINHYLGSLLQKLSPLVKAIEHQNPERIRIFKPYTDFEKLSAALFPHKIEDLPGKTRSLSYAGTPVIKLLGLEFEAPRLAYQLGSVILPVAKAIRHKMKGAGIRNSGLDNRKRVCFLTVNKKMVDVVIPLVNRLGKDPHLAPLVIDWSSNAIEELKKYGIPYSNFDSYLDARIIGRQFKLAGQIGREWRRIRASSTELRKIYYRGYNISRFVIEILDRIFLCNVYLTIRDFLITKRIVGKLNIEAIFVANEREPKAKACVFGGKSCGIKTYNCQRGIIGNHPEVGPIATDKMFVDGEFFKNNLVKRGVDPEKVIITGNPRFDILYDKLPNLPRIRQSLYQTLNLKPDEQLAAIFTQPIDLDATKEDKIGMVRGGLSALRGLKNIRPIIKLHPTQGSSDIEREIVSQLKMANVLLLKEEIDLYDLLMCSRLVILDTTTVGLDAALLGKPIIRTRFRERSRDIIDYAALGVALEARTEEELKSLVERILSDKDTLKMLDGSREKFIREHMYKFDGKSSERVIKVMRNDLLK